MITTYKVPYRDGELRIGWASWDDGKYEARSIKYAYRDSSGKVSRGSPELPFDVLVDMLVLADEQGELGRDRARPGGQGHSRGLSTIACGTQRGENRAGPLLSDGSRH